MGRYAKNSFHFSFHFILSTAHYNVYRLAANESILTGFVSDCLRQDFKQRITKNDYFCFYYPKHKA